MAAQVATYNSNTLNIPYPFLSQPPKKRTKPTATNTSTKVAVSTQPAASPSPRSKIYAWAAAVHASSPTHCSPNSGRRLSISRRRPSFTITRRSSVASTHHALVLSSPDFKDYKPDLATLGYTSVFVKLPKTPSTGRVTGADNASHGVQATPIGAFVGTEKREKEGGLRRLRSLVTLKPLHTRPRSNTTKEKSSAPTPPSPTAHRTPKRKNFPPSFAADLALLQFMDGGKIDTHVTRLMTDSNGAVGVPLRTDGMLWRDLDEQLEYAPLIPGSPGASSPVWVTFSPKATSPLGGEALALFELANQRDSQSTQDSAVVAAVLSPLDPERAFAGRPNAFRSVAPAKTTVGCASTVNEKKSRPPVLCIPARARNGRAGYLLASPSLFPPPPKTPVSPRARPARRMSIGKRIVGGHRHFRQKKRPAPLNLTAISAGSTQGSRAAKTAVPKTAVRNQLVVESVKVDVEAVRREFFACSFEPRLMEVKGRSVFED